MRTRIPFAPLALLAAAIALEGCASTTVHTTGTPMTQPLCVRNGPPVSALVLWEPQWRTDQKEPARREVAAEQGIRDFVSRSGCLRAVDLRRFDTGSTAPTDAMLLDLARQASPAPDRLVRIVVRELGPRLIFGLPVIVEGGTEVVVDVRVLDARSARSMASARTQWRHGGPFVIKGVRSLPQDMSAALEASLLSGATAP